MITQHNDPMIRVQDLTYRFHSEDSAPILRDVCFDIYNRDSVLLLGPSGSGKSTLTFCLNGLYPEAVDGTLEGDILIKGRHIASFYPGELGQQIGVVFQDPESQFCMVTVEDELAFGLENIHTPIQEISNRIDEALGYVGMQDFRYAKIHHLSGGMKQKLALACALAMSPDILILDEPTANLDPVATRDFVQIIHQLHQKHDLTLLIIEHNLDEWVSVVNRTIVLDNQGKVYASGDIREVLQTYGEDLNNMGIWLPTIPDLGNQWKKKKWYQGAPSPLTSEEFIQGITNPAMARQKLMQTLQRENHDHAGLETIVQVSHLTYRHSQKAILKEIKLELCTGELVALVGPNGAGKSTLAQHLAGIYPSQQGEIRLKGKPLSQWKETALRKEIGFVFQNPEHQFITDTVFDEVAYSLRLQGLNEAEVKERVLDTLDRLRLTHLLKENPFSLSQGQKRRLSVATMLVDEQSILILDEPTFGQDAHTTEELLQLLMMFIEQGKSVLMITHDMEIVHRFADRVIVLMEGEITFQGNPTELWEQEETFLNRAKIIPPILVTLEKRMQNECLKSGCLG